MSEHVHVLFIFTVNAYSLSESYPARDYISPYSRTTCEATFRAISYVRECKKCNSVCTINRIASVLSITQEGKGRTASIVRWLGEAIYRSEKSISRLRRWISRRTQSLRLVCRAKFAFGIVVLSPREITPDSQPVNDRKILDAMQMRTRRNVVSFVFLRAR